MKIHKRMLEVLDETIAAYTSETRAINGNGDCYYYTREGRMCAIGRCLEDPKQFEGVMCAVSNIEDYSKGIDFLDLFKPEYRGLPVSFWQELQDLHDVEGNWNKEGLSAAGEACVRDFRNRLEDDDCDHYA